MHNCSEKSVGEIIRWIGTVCGLISDTAGLCYKTVFKNRVGPELPVTKCITLMMKSSPLAGPNAAMDMKC